MTFESGRVAALVTANGERLAFDAYVSALPSAQLLSALSEDIRTQAPFSWLSAMRTSPIVNLHLWFDRPVAGMDFAAFTGSDLQWLFNRTRIAGASADGEEHLVLSQSAADRYVDLDKTQLLELLLPQIQRALPAARSARLKRSVLIKEPDATFVPSPGLRRPGAATPIQNLFLAGAYTDTGWPATMESAVRSGMQAARAVAAWSSQSHLAPVAVV